MRSMAIDAARRQWITALGRLAVQAFRVLLLLVRVTGSAGHRLEFLGMGEFLLLQVAVAGNAFYVGMGRGTQRRRVERWRHAGLPLARTAACFVAGHALLSPRGNCGLLSGREARRPQQPQQQPCPSPPKGANVSGCPGTSGGSLVVQFSYDP